MMYKEKMAVALKHNGKILREVNDTVLLPYGSEYSIFIKNMNSVRALVTITVDGKDVGDGNSFIVGANDNIDIERFIKNNNLDQGNRFKFIERTERIEDHRGIGVEDGLVRVEFRYEQLPSFSYNTSICKNTHTFTNYSYRCIDNNSYWSTVTSTSCEPLNDVGITVEGSISNQRFQEGTYFLTENISHVIVLKILGQTKTNTPVIAPVTVKTKPKCTTCGKVNKALSKFCSECGTSLTLV